MSATEAALQTLEELLTTLQRMAWQQREALVALRVGVVEALAAQQNALLQQLQDWQQRFASLPETLRREPSLQQRWKRLRIQAAEVQRLLQLNRVLAQRAQHHTTALLEALLPEGYLYDRQVQWCSADELLCSP
ncbi:MAG: hypothetical protein NZ960_01390 [Candidatus Kapabacteria bacterium]|nr:hypothetical protein [Candidatus Kapabacteria bacterium]MDW8011680.1 hypothetical protein [Bacteroidota bacterium]